jgi:Protein of unknown function (DUF2726)
VQALVSTPDGQALAIGLLLALYAFVFVLGGLFHRFRTRRAFSSALRYRQQMKAIATGSFQKQRLMNASEFQIFRVLERDVAIRQGGFRVFAQASLGEVLTSASESAYFAVNSKRVDVLIVDKAGYPALAVEYQGQGHNSATSAQRDAIKKTALEKAGVGYLEIFPRDDAEKVVEMVHERLGWNRPVAAGARGLQNRVYVTAGRG